MTIDIRYVDSSATVEWDAFVRRSPLSSHYHQYEWRNFFVELFDKETYYLAAYCDQSIVGVLPLVRQKSLLFGDYLVSLPFLNYGGILADDDIVAMKLVDSVSKLATQLGVSHVELREYEPRSGLQCRTHKVAMRLELPSSADELAKRLGSKVRSQIKRPLQEGPTVLIGGIDLVNQFYEVFSRNMRDIGAPVYAKSMFIDILNRFPRDSTIVLVELLNRPAASAFLINHHDRMEVPWASTDKRYNRFSINMLLYWEILKLSIERGAGIFDFGRSSVDSGTHRFKKQWGAQAVQLNWNYWLKDGRDMPNLTPDNKKYSLAISAWQRLPLPIANFLGPKIVMSLP